MNPSELLQLSGNYWSACALHSAVKLDIFTHLDLDEATAAEIAGLTGCSERGMTMLLNAMTAIGLLTKDTDKFNAPPSTIKFLSKKSKEYLGHIIMHHHHLVSGWYNLDQAVKEGAPVRTSVSRTDDDSARESFLMGMYNLASLAAPHVVPSIDLTGRRRLLDLGGGPGTYAIHFCLHNPDLTAVIYDLESTRRFAEETIDRFELSDRIVFNGGDILNDDIGSGYDVIWISHLLHSEGPEEAGLMLKKAATALLPGGLLLVQEFVLGDDESSPVFPVLFSLNMLIGTEQGQSYTQSELTEMMTKAGINHITRHPLVLPNGAAILCGKAA